MADVSTAGWVKLNQLITSCRPDGFKTGKLISPEFAFYEYLKILNIPARGVSKSPVSKPFPPNFHIPYLNIHAKMQLHGVLPITLQP